MLKTQACNEEIINKIKISLEKEIEYQLNDCEQFEDPDFLDDRLLESYELCNKFLTYNYFERSETYLNKVISRYRKVKGHYKLSRYIWLLLYKIDLHNKKEDLRRLFKLIVDNSEDWC